MMKEKPKLLTLIGKRIKAIKGCAYKEDRFYGKRKNSYVEPRYILFDDGETFIELEDQDYYSYHDADSNAKCIIMRINKDMWNEIMKNKDYVNITTDGCIEVYTL